MKSDKLPSKLPSELLAEAHKAHPEIKWRWSESNIYPDQKPCGCAVALIGFHMGFVERLRFNHEDKGWRVAWSKVSQLWNSLPKLSTRLEEIYYANSHASMISNLIVHCRNFAEAIRRLKAVGW